MLAVFGKSARIWLLVDQNSAAAAVHVCVS
jgi:hypothetical protein